MSPDPIADVFTLFPAMVPGPLGLSLVGNGISRGETAIGGLMGIGAPRSGDKPESW